MLLRQRERLVEGLDQEKSSHRNLKAQLNIQAQARMEIQSQNDNLKSELLVVDTHLRDQILRSKADITKLESQHLKTMDDCTKEFEADLRRVENESESRCAAEVGHCSRVWHERFVTSRPSFDKRLKDGEEYLKNVEATCNAEIQSMSKVQETTNASHKSELAEIRGGHSKGVDRLVGQLQQPNLPFCLVHRSGFMIGNMSS